MAGDEHEVSITQFLIEQMRYGERVADYQRRIEGLGSKLPAIENTIQGLSLEMKSLEKQFLDP